MFEKDEAFDERVTHDELASEAESHLVRTFLVSSFPSLIWLRGTVSIVCVGIQLAVLAAVKSVCVSIVLSISPCV
tara:strand:- start:42 stop:266 length:225 start_codon:yes stop_codon:yes gene_type:complete